MTNFGDPTWGLYCCICFEGLTTETAAVDKYGAKWDTCKGECARQAGIEEQEETINCLYCKQEISLFANGMWETAYSYRCYAESSPDERHTSEEHQLG